MSNDESLFTNNEKKIFDKSIRNLSRRKRKEFVERHKKEIAERERHDSYVQLVIFPFLNRDSYMRNYLGYRLYACDPFYEDGNKNFDCLVYKKDDKKLIAIFIEVKTGYNPEEIVKDFKEKCEAMEKNKDILDRTFSDNIVKRIEYVICIDAINVSYVQQIIEKEIIELSYKMIIWQIGSIKPPHKLKIIYPSEIVKKKFIMLHDEKELNRYLISNNNNLMPASITFFPQSHPVTKLKALVTFMKSHAASANITGNENKKVFDKQDFLKFCSANLLNHSKDTCQLICDEILGIALTVDLINHYGENSYIINRKYQNKSFNKSLAEKLWLDYKLRAYVKEIDDLPLEYYFEKKLN